MSRRHVSKQRESSSRVSSASRDSEADVKPTRSAKRTETSRRSACGAGSASFSGDDAEGVSAAPHSPQKRSPGALAAPHSGHVSASFAPHCEQNFLLASFSVPLDVQL